ncbi:hypothetical protein DHEL01_v204297 [Diaporthe helianthi]|uniref:DNA replication checkpoint mediator MRC1 domain-containing protein n=1 Tax=Diaporthe helianthi TaxID=158607 RepID=A0A2P5I489_DIAHE|nr:hypothetical protein DHEL01_v204297 [Diaporthe helianthi]
MASSQPTSPVRSPSPDRFELSPNSKLKKLLAGVDSDSDEDNTQVPKKTSPFARRVSPTASDRSNDAPERDSSDEDAQPRGPLASRMQAAQDDARARVRNMLQHANAKQSRAGSADVEMANSTAPGAPGSDSEDDIVRPRGRLASRMQGGDKSAEQVARLVMEESAAVTGTHQACKDGEDSEMADGGADDEEGEVSIRQRKIRQRRSKTPESNVASPQREASPGLFVTPSKSPTAAQPSSQAEDSGSDADVPVLKSNRFQALIEKKRNERLAREAEEARKREARAAVAEELGDDNDDDVSDISDDEGGRKLTQTQKAKTRPSRQASKKALEEMNRETQRMQRAMQLAHEAKTKKKIPTATLFERFNFNPGGNAAKDKLQSSSGPQTPTSAKSTDAEMRDRDTPPSSPPARVEDVLGKDLVGLQSHAGATVPQPTTVRPEEQAVENEDDFPDLMDMQAFARKPVDKGKGKANTPEVDTKRPSKRQVRIKLPPMKANRVDLGSGSNQDSGDDDDLVILDEKRSRLDALFDRAPKDKTKESRSLYALRQLAHLDSPERKAQRKAGKAAMTPGELQAFLNQRARDQARLEKERRMEMLKAKGIHIQTEEERERDREHIEDMVARARREAEEIMAREREDAKKEKRSSGKADPLAWDDSASDDDYVEGENQNAAEVDLSGSEVDGEDDDMIDGDATDEENEDAGEQDRNKQDSAARPFVDEDAEEDSASEASSSGPSFVDPDEEEERHRWGASDEEADEAPAFVQARRPKKPTAIVPDEEADDVPALIRARRQKRHTVIMSDDEDGSDVEATPKPKTRPFIMTPAPKSRTVDITPAPNSASSPEVPKSVLRSANKTFIPGLPVNVGGPAGLCLTQIFAGTMDSQTAAPFEGSPSQPMPTFDNNFPDSQFSQRATDSADGMVIDSQLVPATEQNETLAGDESQIQFNFTQSQTHGLDSLLRDDIMTQASDMMDPTQDDGFQDWTPLKERFVDPPSATADTVPGDASQAGDLSHQSPLVQKRGRLIRKAALASESEEEAEVADSIAKPTAFNVLQDAAAKEKRRKAREDFIKKKSKAKEMVEEQAEESEDEYAGLGGVDGEDSDEDDAASVHEMIDDQTQNNQADEVAIAKFYVDRAREDDEKQVDKLFKDITTGMLRRKRGAGEFDLDDDDDGGEARRRMKRRQFAKMQKALFADERISKVAENPRNQAFMRTIEDIGSDEEMDFLYEPAPGGNKDSQDESQDNQPPSPAFIVPDSQPAATGTMAAPPKRAPAAERRTKPAKKPSNIGEIRETLSNLLDEPSGNSIVSATDFGSDSEEEGGDDVNNESSNKENANPRRARHTGQVVDRISLKRQGSSNMSNASTGGGGGGGARLAFAAPNSNSGGFKVPALLRRATTNSLISTGSSASTASGKGGAAAAAAAGTGSAGGFGDDAKIKSKAGKRSGISYLARENDRRKAVDEAEKRREQRKFRAVEGRSKVVGGLFGAGKFE